MNNKIAGIILSGFTFVLLGCSSLGSGEITGDFTHIETLDKEESKLLSLFDSDPQNSQASLGLGWIYIHKKKYPKAVAMFNQSLKITGNNPRAYMGLGMAYEKLENYEFCIRSYKQALKLKPSWYYAHYELGKVFHKIGKKQSYFTELDTLVAKQPDLANNLLEIIYHQKSGS